MPGMNRLARRIPEAPAATRRATGVVVLVLLAAAVGLGGPATAQSGGPSPFAGSSECIGPESPPQEQRLVDDQGRAVFHGTTFGIQLAADTQGSVYVGDVYMVRRVPPNSAPALYTAPERAPYIRGVAAVGSQVFFSDVSGASVQVRLRTGPDTAQTVFTGPSAGGDSTRQLEHGLATAADGSLYLAAPAAGQIFKVGGSAPLSGTPLTTPQSLVAVEENEGTVLYVAGGGSRVTRVVAATGAATPFGPALNVAGLSARVAADPVGKQLFVADSVGIFQIDLPTGTFSRIVEREGETSALAVVRSSPQGDPRLVFANWNVDTGTTRTTIDIRTNQPIEVPVLRCDLESVVPNEPAPIAKTPDSSAPPTTGSPTTLGQRVDNTTPPLTAPSSDPQPFAQNNVQQQQQTDPEQLLGNRAEGDFGQFNPFVGTQGVTNSQFTPFLGGGGQNLGGFAPQVGSDPFSGGGVPVLTGGPGEAAAAGAPPASASVANPGPVGVAAPPPAGAPLGGASPVPVQGWAGAPADQVQGATRYAMTADEGGRDPLLYGLLGLGGCCLLLAIGAGTRRGGRAAATATAAKPAKAWAAGR